MVIEACLVGLSGEGLILSGIGIGSDVCRKECMLVVLGREGGVAECKIRAGLIQVKVE